MLGSTYAQQVTVKDELTGEALPDVAIYNEDKTNSIISDINGFVDLDIFSNDEKIYFQLLGYSTIQKLLSELNSVKTIYLQPQNEALDEVILSVARSESNVNQI